MMGPPPSILPYQFVCYNRSDNGASYRGVEGSTTGGGACQAWTSQRPHIQFMTPYNFPQSGLLRGPYCRNPGDATKTRPWCFTENVRKINENDEGTVISPNVSK